MRLTEIIECSSVPQSEINEETMSRLDLSNPRTRTLLIALRKQQRHSQSYMPVGIGASKKREIHGF